MIMLGLRTSFFKHVYMPTVQLETFSACKSQGLHMHVRFQRKNMPVFTHMHTANRHMIMHKKQLCLDAYRSIPNPRLGHNIYACLYRHMHSCRSEMSHQLHHFQLPCKVHTNSFCDMHERSSSLQIKKRKKKVFVEDIKEVKPGHFSITALATAEEYDLEHLKVALISQDLYIATFLDSEAEYTGQPEILHASAKYEVAVDSEPRDIFFFREGSIVSWNVSELEFTSLLELLRPYEQQSYPESIVLAESEALSYCYKQGKKSGLFDGDVILNKGNDTLLEKFTISNALALSVKLGSWESSLEKYIDSIEYVTEDLKTGLQIKMSQAQVLRKTGELFALRHMINLRSDLLDTPDFYWDREHLEPLYTRTREHFSISRRTKVMNERLNHCIELVELLRAQLSDQHHVRLEWMIIILIMVEVGFEVLHYCDKLFLHASNTQ